jgi:hypothetical protein
MTRNNKTEVSAAKSSLRECYSAKKYRYWLEGLQVVISIARNSCSLLSFSPEGKCQFVLGTEGQGSISCTELPGYEMRTLLLSSMRQLEAIQAING